MSDIKLFEDRKVRSHWDEKEEQWYFSVIDVIEVLTNSANPRDYWFKMKIRIKSDDGLELSTICRQLKLKATDGKMRITDVANTQNLISIIQIWFSKLYFVTSICKLTIFQKNCT